MARFLALLTGCFQMRNSEIPIRMYRVVQTGPKIQLGGLNEGLFNVSYHPATACEVNIPAMLPNATGNKTEMISLKNLDRYKVLCI